MVQCALAAERQSVVLRLSHHLAFPAAMLYSFLKQTHDDITRFVLQVNLPPKLLDDDAPERTSGMLTASWTVFVDYYPQYMQVYRKIAKTAWFQQHQWTAFVGHYTHGIFLQLSKPHWYNAQFDGIHFELAMDSACVQKRVASIQLHITHKAVLPDREAFNAYTIPRMHEVIRTWDTRYEFSATKPSERLSCTVSFTPTTFVSRVTEVLTQACQLETIIDDALEVLWPKGKAHYHVE